MKTTTTGRKGPLQIDLKSAVSSLEIVPTVREDMGFDELARAYLATHHGAGDMQLRKWIAFFGNRCAWSITTPEIDSAGEAMIEAGYSPSTVNRNVSQLGSLYIMARKRKLCPAGFISPTRACRRYEERSKAVAVTPLEVARLIDAAALIRDRRFQLLVRLLAESGARRSEVLERQWRDFDFDKRTIMVDVTKNGSARVLHYSEESAELIRRIWPRPLKPDALLFESKRTPGKPICFKRHWQTVTAAIGRPDLRLHDLRHHRAAEMLRAGVPIGIASQALGHSSEVFIRRYAHLDNSAQHEALRTSWRAA